MKYMICVLLTLVSFSLLAVIRTVDNNNPSAGQYTTISAAISAASNDDIIYVYPSNTAYAGFNVNKRLKIYGVGWQGTTANIRKSMINGTVVFESGSEYSELYGFDNGFGIWMNGVSGNILIANCLLSSVSFNPSYSWISANSSNYTFMSCMFNGGGSRGRWFDYQYTPTGILISNCVFIGSAWLMDGTSSNITVINTIIISTNTLFANLGSNPSLRSNYISATGFTSGTSTSPSDPVIAYNISSTALFPSGTTNYNNIPLSGVFDSQYRPIPGSPAIDAGDPAVEYNDLDGSRNDIGAFGGPCPFDDNGFTTLPTITDISGTLYTSPSQGLQIHVEASSRH